MESTRQKKVARLVHKELAEIIMHHRTELAPGKMISVTTVRVSPCFEKAIDRLSILRRGWVILYRLIGVKGIAHGFANKNQQRKQHGHGKKGGDA